MKKITGIFIFFCCVIVCTFFSPTKSAKAVGNTYTICGAGCDFATVTEAISSSTLSEDILLVSSTYIYDDSAELASASFKSSSRLVCATGADTIGSNSTSTLVLSLDTPTSTIESCSFENVEINISGTDVTIENNSFSTSTPSVMTAAITADRFTLSGNTGLHAIFIDGADDVTVEDNTFEFTVSTTSYGLSVNALGATTSSDYYDDSLISNGVYIAENQFINYMNDFSNDVIIFNAGDDIEFVSNTYESPVVQLGSTFYTVLTIQAATATIHHNVFTIPTQGTSTNNMVALNLRVTSANTYVHSYNNSVFFESPLAVGTCAMLFDDGAQPELTVTWIHEFNLCFDQGGNSFGLALNSSVTSTDTNLVFTDRYNGFNGFSSIFFAADPYIGYSLSTTTITSSPMLLSTNIDDADYGLPNPLSTYIDVLGTRDVGAKSNNRPSPIIIDEDCVVDYVTCHATSTAVITDTGRDNDVFTIRAGIYSEFTIQNADNILVDGAGTSTIIESDDDTTGVTFFETSSSTVKDLIVRGAETSTIRYILTSPNITDGVTSYDVGVGVPAYLKKPGAACDTDLIVSPTDITSFNGVGIGDINLVLPTSSFFALTTYVNSEFATSSAAILAKCAGSLPPGFIIDYFVPSLFVLEPDGSYTYDTDALADAGLSTVGGAPEPMLELIPNVGAGIIFGQNADDNLVYGVTSTMNGRGVYFSSTADNNRVVESSFADNTEYDAYSDADGDNQFIDTTFTLASTTVEAAGDIDVYYSFSVSAEDADTSLPIGGATITVNDDMGGAVATLLTSGLGETALSSPVLAYTLETGVTPSATNGGYNPHTATFASTSSYPMVSQEFILISPRQEVSLSVATVDAVVEEEESGDRGFYFAPTSPKVDGAELNAFVINNNASETANREVHVTFSRVQNAKYVALSNTNNFAGISFVPFTTTIKHTLSPGNGTKTVYARLLSEEGGELVLKDSIILGGQSFDAEVDIDPKDCPLAIDSPYKTASEPGVYYITEHCTKRIFTRSDVYFTYFRNWDAVEIVSESVLDQIPLDEVTFSPWGPLYDPQSGSLVKTLYDAKVYLLLYNTLYHIKDESAAEYQFGSNWASWIEDVDRRLIDAKTISASELGLEKRPDGILITYADDVDVYVLETNTGEQQKRFIPDEVAFESLGYRWDRIVTIPSEEMYPDGESL